MTLLGFLVILLILAIILPMFGVSLEPQLMRIVTLVIVVALIVWLFTGSGLLRV